ncbi:MAG: phosphodiester glycosidase family protein [Candidatus Riflebacteria bacterium]|nr:phosphodiester glycosidase family protein [Candidatus Riflebacteria bacterium]
MNHPGGNGQAGAAGSAPSRPSGARPFRPSGPSPTSRPAQEPSRPGLARVSFALRVLAGLALTAGLALGPGRALAGESLKGTVRSWFGLLSQSAAEPAPGPLPAGAALVSWPGGRGVRLDPGRFRVQPIVWTGSHGLLEELGRRTPITPPGSPVQVGGLRDTGTDSETGAGSRVPGQASPPAAPATPPAVRVPDGPGPDFAARADVDADAPSGAASDSIGPGGEGRPGAGPLGAINGSFYSTQGVLGQVVIDGDLPRQPRQLPASLSRCFVAEVTGPGGPRWLLGETAARGQALLAPDFLAGAAMNRPLRPGERLRNLLGGGGWIVREGKDVHMEAYGRQRFRFRKVDQDSRHTVLAMDRDDRLYLLVFETGANLAAVSAALRDPSRFPDGITDAIFLDGGSSSVLVWAGRNLVAPLYLVDKARFSALAVWPVAP